MFYKNNLCIHMIFALIWYCLYIVLSTLVSHDVIALGGKLAAICFWISDAFLALPLLHLLWGILNLNLWFSKSVRFEFFTFKKYQMEIWWVVSVLRKCRIKLGKRRLFGCLNKFVTKNIYKKMIWLPYRLAICKSLY